MKEEAHRRSRTEAGVARFGTTMTIVMLFVSPSISGRTNLSGELGTNCIFLVPRTTLNFQWNFIHASRRNSTLLGTNKIFFCCFDNQSDGCGAGACPFNTFSLSSSSAGANLLLLRSLNKKLTYSHLDDEDISTQKVVNRLRGFDCSEAKWAIATFKVLHGPTYLCL